MELWDELDVMGKPTGRTLVRNDEIPKGSYHLVVSVWVADPLGRLLTTLRAPDKDGYPNTWENTAGSALQGESSREAAIRELREETSIIIREDQLVFIRRLTRENSFIDIYFVRLAVTPDELSLQEGETSAYRWVTMEELDDMILANEFAPPIVRRLAVIRGELERAIEQSAQ